MLSRAVRQRWRSAGDVVHGPAGQAPADQRTASPISTTARMSRPPCCSRLRARADAHQREEAPWTAAALLDTVLIGPGSCAALAPSLRLARLSRAPAGCARSAARLTGNGCQLRLRRRAGCCRKGVVRSGHKATLAQAPGLGFGAGAHSPPPLSVLHVGLARFRIRAVGQLKKSAVMNDEAT